MVPSNILRMCDVAKRVCALWVAYAVEDGEESGPGGGDFCLWCCCENEWQDRLGRGGNGGCGDDYVVSWGFVVDAGS